MSFSTASGLCTIDANENLLKSHMRSTMLGIAQNHCQININYVGVYPCPSAWVQDCAWKNIS
eukprot:2042754-Amphidinium_carterae.1